MYQPKHWRSLATALLCTAAVGCAGVQPVAYSGMASSAELKPNPQDSSGRVPYRYTTPVDWRTYHKLIVDPVVVYQGADNQFGTMSEQDRAALASYMQARFADKLQKRFELTDSPGPDTLRLRLTLTGAKTTTQVISTLLRFDIAGGLYNGVQSIRGGEGSLTGSVFYAVEIYDASTNQLLDAYVTKQYPVAMNVGATFGSLHAAKTGINKGADALVAQLK
jgi:hypothetical protein